MDIARTYDIPLVGPNCLGIMRPRVGLNATFAKSSVRTGHVALVAQSGAFCTALLDWADTEGFGFSAVASLGATADVGFGEVLDYLAVDPETRSILLYVEGITNARSFMSGLRVAARLKPVIVVKSGRNESGTRAAVSHTGALVGADHVFDAAIERAGAVRVQLSQPAVRRRPPARLRTPAWRDRAWPSSPTAAARASWPPTGRRTSACRWPS